MVSNDKVGDALVVLVVTPDDVRLETNGNHVALYDGDPDGFVGLMDSEGMREDVCNELGRLAAAGDEMADWALNEIVSATARGGR